MNTLYDKIALAEKFQKKQVEAAPLTESTASRSADSLTRQVDIVKRASASLPESKPLNEAIIPRIY